MRRLKKKGQFYIFLSLILLAYIAALRPSLDSAEMRRTSYTQARDNFMTESGYVINNAIFEEADIRTRLDSFVETYRDYQAVQGMNISLIYLLSTDDTLYLRNYYRDAVVGVENVTYDLGRNSELTLDRAEEVSINASEYEYYTFEIDPGRRVDFQTVFKVEME